MQLLLCSEATRRICVEIRVLAPSFINFFTVFTNFPVNFHLTVK